MQSAMTDTMPHRAGRAWQAASDAACAPESPLPLSPFLPPNNARGFSNCKRFAIALTSRARQAM